MQKSNTKSGLSVSLRFSIAQHSRDALLLESFINFFHAGQQVRYKNRTMSEFIVTKSHDIISKIVPFFDRYPILGCKYLNYLKFNTAAYIISNKEHLNEDGLGLAKFLQLKKEITAQITNKVIKKHRIEIGTEKNDRKR